MTEPDETFTASISNPQGGGGPDPVVGTSTATTTIVDDDPHTGNKDPKDEPPEWLIDLTLDGDPNSVSESATSTAVTVTATHRSGTHPSDVTVKLMRSGTASEGRDYFASALEAVTIPANERSGSEEMRITPLDDNLVEGDETIAISGEVEGFQVASSEITITDDDTAEDIILSVNPAELAENASSTDVTVTATFVAATQTTDTTVVLALNGSASSDDYRAEALASITIPAGQQIGSGTLRITPIDDSLVEGDETIIVEGSASEFKVKTASITISDDDTPLCYPSPDLQAAWRRARRRSSR